MTEDDLVQINEGYAKMIATPSKADSLSQQELLSAQAAQIDPELFVKVLSRIVRVIKYNFLKDLNREASPGLP